MAQAKPRTVEIMEGLRTRCGGEVRCWALIPKSRNNNLKTASAFACKPRISRKRFASAKLCRFTRRFYTQHADPNELLKRLQLEDKRDAFWNAFRRPKTAPGAGPRTGKQSCITFSGRAHHWS